MGLVDFHSHFFSRPFFEALAAASPRPGSAEEKLAGLAAETGIEVPPEDVGEHLERWLGELERHGVDHLVTFASLPEEIPAVGEAVEASGGRLSGVALVDPKADGAAGMVRELLGGGFAGVLTFPAMHHFAIDGDEARAVYDAVNDHGGLVFVHCGILIVKLRDLLGLPRVYDLRYADPLHLVPAANAFPEVKFVVPHFGAGFFRETLIAGAQCDNVHVDTSSSNSWMRTDPAGLTLRDVFQRALGVFGPERILFGTDSNAFPAGWRAERLEEQRSALYGIRVSAEDQEKVFAGNARRLLGLE